jgi:hypothetical protein
MHAHRQIPEPLSRTLAGGAEAVDILRRRSHWHWVDLGRLFGCLEGGVNGASIRVMAS